MATVNQIRKSIEASEKALIKYNKCKTFGVDENKVVARHPNVTGKGFTVILTDGKDREIDARVIWAAEYSEFVCPHTRYIVTERHN